MDNQKDIAISLNAKKTFKGNGYEWCNADLGIFMVMDDLSCIQTVK